MKKTIDVETTTTELIKGKDIINVEIIGKKALPQFIQYNAQIVGALEDLKLKELVANASEENLDLIKKARTEVRKDTASDETRRKLVEKLYTEPLNHWKDMYKKYVFTPRNNADKDLKDAQDKVENNLRKTKTKIYENLFEKLKEETELDFVKFEDLRLNVQISTSDKELKNQVHDFFEKVTRDVMIIKTEKDHARVLVEYMKHLDLAKAMVEVKSAIELEERLKSQQEAALKAKVEPVEEKPSTNTPEKVKPAETIKVSFTVTGTREEIIGVRTYMQEKGIKYE